MQNTSSGKPTHEATIERAISLSNIAIFTIELQHRRIGSQEPEDTEFLFRQWADFHFFIVALQRLRHSAKIATKVPKVSSFISEAINKYDADLPFLKTMRDVAEHIEEYAFSAGLHTNIYRQQLQVGSVTDGKIFNWLDMEVDIDRAFEVAKNLFHNILEAENIYYSSVNKDVSGI